LRGKRFPFLFGKKLQHRTVKKSGGTWAALPAPQALAAAGGGPADFAKFPSVDAGKSFRHGCGGPEQGKTKFGAGLVFRQGFPGVRATRIMVRRREFSAYSWGPGAAFGELLA